MLFIKNLIWNDQPGGNIAHIARHNVSPDEVEQVCAGEHLAQAAHSERIEIIGRTDTGRLLSIILGPMRTRPDEYYPVTARDADTAERRLYYQFEAERAA